MVVRGADVVPDKVQDEMIIRQDMHVFPLQLTCKRVRESMVEHSTDEVTCKQVRDVYALSQEIRLVMLG
jgi:hypothetical protein